jgi:hypothetical protein
MNCWYLFKSVRATFEKIATLFLELIRRAKIFGAVMFIFTRRWPMIGKLLNGEYERNPSDHLGASEAHIQTYTHTHMHALTCMRVTIDGFWIHNRIYRTNWYSVSLHFTLHYYIHTHTNVHSHVFTSRCSVSASNGGRFLSIGYPNYPRTQLPASKSNTSQRLNLSSSLTAWLTQSLNWLHWLTPLLITSRHG